MDLDSLLLKLRHNINTKLWYQFGQEIGVPTEFLEQIKAYPDDQCMIEVSDHWLRNHPDKPTWQEVEDAITNVGPIQTNTDVPGEQTECKECPQRIHASILHNTAGPINGYNMVPPPRPAKSTTSTS